VEISKELIEQNWPLTGVLFDRVLQENSDRLVALINSDQGKFVYKVASPWKTAEALKKDTSIFPFLEGGTFNFAPKLLKTKIGESFAKIDSRFVYLLKYQEGENPKLTVETYTKLGEILAQLHSIADYPYHTDFDPQYIIENNFKENAAKLSFGEEYLKIAETLPNFSKFPQSLIHTEIGPRNTVEKADGSLVLIDWDDVGIGPTVLDLGYPLISQFTTEDFELKPDLAKAFYISYFKKRQITVEEKNALFDASLFFALMYLIYGDTNKRWERLDWSLKNRKPIESMVP